MKGLFSCLPASGLLAGHSAASSPLACIWLHAGKPLEACLHTTLSSPAAGGYAIEIPFVIPSRWVAKENLI